MDGSYSVHTAESDFLKSIFLCLYVSNLLKTRYLCRKEYWIVDPIAKAINVFLLQTDGKYDLGTVYEHNQKTPVHIFEGLEIDLNELFES